MHKNRFDRFVFFFSFSLFSMRMKWNKLVYSFLGSFLPCNHVHFTDIFLDSFKSERESTWHREKKRLHISYFMISNLKLFHDVFMKMSICASWFVFFFIISFFPWIFFCFFWKKKTLLLLSAWANNIKMS